MTAAEWLAEVKARNTPSEIAPGTSSRDIETFREGQLGFVMAEGWLRASADALVLVAAIEAVLAEVATFESLVRDDIGDAGIPAWGDGYLRGYHDAAIDIRERIAAALDPS